MIISHTQKSRIAAWGCAAGLVAVLGFFAVFSLLAQQSAASHSRAADGATRRAAAYGEARFWVGQEESLERKYRLEPSSAVRLLHTQAEAHVSRDLALIGTLDRTAATRRLLVSVERSHAGYVRASRRLFAAVDDGNVELATRIDHADVDPVFGAVQDRVDASSKKAIARALRESRELRDQETATLRAIAVAFALGLLLIAGFVAVLLELRRRLSRFHTRELAAMEELAMSDPLTGVGNHRAFHEDLDRAVLHCGNEGVPVALVLLDLDGLKVVNDTLGHQAGDEQIKVVADTLRTIMRAEDRVYRVGGDEFAVLCEGVDAARAAGSIQRVRDALWAADCHVRVSFSAGISESTERRHKDALIREADLALIAAKRGSLAVSVYSAELDTATQLERGGGRMQTGTLANALALAVDAKDSYTRSHCQTVSRLCALVATELGLGAERVVQMRLAGLLHDVGKIGVPDAILNKPGRLDEAEFEIMKRHSTLGGDIVAAANLPEESYWVRHHHERYDGAGYPSQLRGREIPLESRIILACDAYEAMTSNRSYRKAPGHAFAIAEIRKNAGTQFDPEVVGALCRALDRHKVDPVGSFGELAEAA